MPKFIVDGMRDGSNDPLYVEAANADEALSKAQAKGMQTTGVRPAKVEKPLSITVIYSLGVAFYVLEIILRVPVGASVFALLAIKTVASTVESSQTTIQKLEQEVAALRAIVNEQRKTDLREPRLTSAASA